MLPQAGSEETLEVAKRLRSDFEAEMLDEGLTISLGVATCPDHAQSAAGLYKSVDDALYAAKRGGKNRVVVAKTE